MKYQKISILVFCLLAISGITLSQNNYSRIPEMDTQGINSLPDNVLPVQACWFWRESVFAPEGYKAFLDSISLHSPYNLISASVRLFGKETTSDVVYNQMKLATEYAASKGISMVADLDIRTARRAFESKYPDELQEMLLLKEINQQTGREVKVTVLSKDLSDHYTGRTTHYIPLSGRLLRVYSYDMAEQEIEPNSLEDITHNCIVISSGKDSVEVLLPSVKKNRKACVMVSFTHLYPDVFAPHLIDFQHEIIQKYSDVPLAGVFKDEWGFPPSFDGSPAKDQFWYSQFRAKTYAEETGGRDLIADCLLMHRGIKGKERERQMVINNFMEMSWKRNAAIEAGFYHSVKEIFGSDAAVTTHPTWWPYPDLREQMKNGLDWWYVKRDWAQTDETTPFAVRTALAKKWGSPVWYNMFYDTERAAYETAVWSAVLAGGRINYHPIYPSEKKGLENNFGLLRGELVLAESRVRLLNFISKSPLDCPVAVIFGHACTMNWAGPSYDDVGMELANALWLEGIPTDLIPSGEIERKNLVVDKDGWISYGQQKYSAVILYHPEFEKKITADFFNKAADGKTQLFRMGEWTRDFDANDYDGKSALPEMIVPEGKEQFVGKVKDVLKQQNIKLQTPAVKDTQKAFGHPFVIPATSGFCRLIDGTIIQISGAKRVGGDPIHFRKKIEGRVITVDAIGLAAIRLAEDGQVEAIAAGGLSSFKAGKFKIDLAEPVDLALWKNDREEWEGVLQGWKKEIPAGLLKITPNWKRIGLPTPLSEENVNQ